MEALTAEQQRALEAIVAAVPALLAEAYGEAEAHTLGRSVAEAEQGGPLFLDLCHDGLIRLDPEGWAAAFLQRYRERLAAQGSERVPWGEGWCTGASLRRCVQRPRCGFDGR